MVSLDPSLVILFFFAITCIMYGSHKSYAFWNQTLVEHKEAAEAVSSMKYKNVAIFIAVGSTVLLALFFFFKIIFFFLLFIIIIISFISLFFVLSPAVDAVFRRYGWEKKEISIPRIPPIPVNIIAISLICVAITLTWILTGYWLIVNCIAWCIGVTQMAVIRLRHLKIAVALLFAFLIYDVFWVFISPYIFGTSVMVEVAVSLPSSSLPMALTMPRLLSNGYALLGLGDVVLPGFFISFVYAFDLNLVDLYVTDDNVKAPPKLSYYTLSLLAYAVGFAITLISFMLMETGQPALLYLVPCTVGAVAIHSYFNGHIHLMWKGIDAPKRDIEDKDLSVISSNLDDGGNVAPSSSLLGNQYVDSQEIGDNNNSNIIIHTTPSVEVEDITTAMKEAV